MDHKNNKPHLIGADNHLTSDNFNVYSCFLFFSVYKNKQVTFVCLTTHTRPEQVNILSNYLNSTIASDRLCDRSL